LSDRALNVAQFITRQYSLPGSVCAKYSA